MIEMSRYLISMSNGVNGLRYFSKFGCRTPKSGAPQRDNHLNQPHLDHGRRPTSAEYYRPPAHHFMQNNVYNHVLCLYVIYIYICGLCLLITQYTFSQAWGAHVGLLSEEEAYYAGQLLRNIGCNSWCKQQIVFKITAICLRMWYGAWGR